MYMGIQVYVPNLNKKKLSTMYFKMQGTQACRHGSHSGTFSPNYWIHYVRSVKGQGQGDIFSVVLHR